MILLLAFPLLLAANLQDLRVEHDHVLAKLNEKNPDGKVMELDDPRVPDLLHEGWQLAGEWAAAYLEGHPHASPRDLQQIFAGFAPKPKSAPSQYGSYLEYNEYSLTGSAVRVAPSVYVVEASYGVDFRTSTFMVVSRSREGHFAARWNIKDLAARHYPQRDEIGRWMHLVRRAYYNGPLNVSKVLPLPRAANGHARFLVDAYQAADGGTLLCQLSIWEWDGAQANPLLVESYAAALQSDPLRFDGRTLRISTKETVEKLYSCGMCQEPQGLWSIRVTPAGIRNLGHRFRQPEIQWADQVLSTIASGADASRLADRKVIDALHHDTGMLSQCKVFRRGQRGEFLLVVDEGTLRFTYRLRAGRPYFTKVEPKWADQ